MKIMNMQLKLYKDQFYGTLWENVMSGLGNMFSSNVCCG